MSFGGDVEEAITRLVPCVGADGALDSAAQIFEGFIVNT